MNNFELRKKIQEREGLKKFLNEAINMTDKFPVEISTIKDLRKNITYTVRMGTK